jgi:hypothetical protein
MNFPGCNHARQSGWQDSAVGEHLSHLITRCSSCKRDRAFCSKLSIENGFNTRTNSSSRRSGGVPQPPSLASLIQPTPDVAHQAGNSLDGKCKFCALYESEIRLADHIKQTLLDYNMALLFDEARLTIKAESKIYLALIDFGTAHSRKRISFTFFVHGRHYLSARHSSRETADPSANSGACISTRRRRSREGIRY